MGRRSKLNDTVQERLRTAILGGNYFDAACRYAGIAPETGYDWLNRGEAEHPKRPSAPKYVQFAKVIREAEAAVEVRMVAQWQNQMPDDWRAIQLFMERRYPDRWGRKERQEVSGPQGGPIQLQPVLAVSPESLAEAARILDAVESQTALTGETNGYGDIDEIS